MEFQRGRESRKDGRAAEVQVPESELRFETSRSGGPGGQNVNKVETKVRLIFDPWLSKVLTWEQKGLLARDAEVRSATNSNGDIVVVSQEHRTQGANKRRAVEKLHDLLNRALAPKEERKETEVPRSAIAERREMKEHRAQRKQQRRERFDQE